MHMEINNMLEEKVKELFPKFGFNKTKMILKINQKRLKKIIDDNNLLKLRRINMEDFYDIKSKDVSYFLGLLWADGHVSKNNNMVNIECNSEDMLSFRKSLDSFGNWSFYNRKRERNKIECKPLTNAYICDSLLKSFLVENDFLEKSIKSPTKILSKIPKELVKYFLLGIIDGDGCFYFRKGKSNQFYLSGTYNQDWSQIEILFKSIGVDIKKIKVKNKSKYSAIRVTNVNDIKKIGDFIYSSIEKDNIGLKRKYEKYKLIVENLIHSNEIKEYIKKNIHKSKKELLSELNITLFRINKIISEINS